MCVCGCQCVCECLCVNGQVGVGRGKDVVLFTEKWLHLSSGGTDGYPIPNSPATSVSILLSGTE